MGMPLASLILQKLTRVEIKSVHGPIPEVGNKKSVIEAADTFEGRPRHSPGRIELALAHEPR